MKQEDKELLLADLCARLPYRCRVFYEYVDELNGKTYGYSINLNTWCIDELEANKAVIKPYLRPMSSMTEEEKKNYYALCTYYDVGYYEFDELTTETVYNDTCESIDYLNSIHVDYRGLIPKGLAIAVTKENNPYEDINL